MGHPASGPCGRNSKGRNPRATTTASAPTASAATAAFHLRTRFSRNKYMHATGTTVIANKNDATMAKLFVYASGRKRRPS